MSSKLSYMRLHKIFDQASEDPLTLAMDGRGYLALIIKGVKIVKDIETGIVGIYNTFSKSQFPPEITQDQYKTFENYGWKEGVKTIHIYNLNKNIRALKFFIMQEKNTNKNSKRIKSLLNKLKNAKDELQKTIGGQDRPPNRKER
tara:strand:+ start:551 stop:985 length:435 start_codon:yes stop_codon:yes gene_type:complete